MVATARGTQSSTPGNSVSSTFLLHNAAPAQAELTPRFSLPEGWTVVLGIAPFTLASGASDVWVVSLSVPARIVAGKYVIGVALEQGPSGDGRVLRDSIVVEIQERRAVELKIVSAPVYVISGEAYQVKFGVMNRGNSRALYRVTATSALNSARLDSSAVSLKPGETKVLTARVGTKGGSARAADDLLEIRAAYASDSAVHADVSATISIVPPAGLHEPLLTIPARLRLRAAPSASGSSPYEFSGEGRLHESGTDRLSFLFRGSPGKNSPFGDRDEYRAELSGRNYHLRGGDQFFSLSPLLTGGQTGFGAGGDLSAGFLGTGGYYSRFRREPGNLAEFGGFLSAHTGDAVRGTELKLEGLDHPTGPLAGKTLGTTATIHAGDLLTAELEYARSSSAEGAGTGRAARVSGSIPFHFDVSHIDGDSLFTGPPRGAMHDYATITGSPIASLQLTAAGSKHRNRFVFNGLSDDERFNTGSLSAALGGLLSLEYVATQRSTQLATVRSVFSERGMVARTTGSVGGISYWAAAEKGRGKDTTTLRRNYSEFSGGATIPFGASAISGYADLYNGGSINRGPLAVLNVGGNADIRLPGSVSFFVTAFKSAPRDHVTPGYLQLESRLTKALANGSSLSLRVRHSQQPNSVAPATLGYFEYTIPFGLPVSRASLGGRAIGRILDSETGRGVPNALVRLGPQSALTDAQGRAFFSGLPTGEFRASVAQRASSAPSIVVGNPDLTVDSADRSPHGFTLSVARPATVTGTVTEMIVVRSGIGDEPDSLIEGSGVPGVTVALIAGKDTLYRVTDDAGRFSSSELPPGQWLVAVADEAPPQKRYEPASRTLALRPGENASIAFHLAPVRRKIRIIGGSGQ